MRIDAVAKWKWALKQAQQDVPEKVKRRWSEWENGGRFWGRNRNSEIQAAIISASYWKKSKLDGLVAIFGVVIWTNCLIIFYLNRDIMMLPLLKLGTLAVRTISKPLAAKLKQQAGKHPKFRTFIISIAQVMIPFVWSC